jgi:MFS family permease
MYFGTRPTFLVAATGLFVTTIWSAVAQSFASLEASRILCAFCAGAGEALPATVVQHLFFLHQRGLWLGIYTFLLSTGSSIGVFISGFVITSWGWRWHFWVCFCKNSSVDI